MRVEMVSGVFLAIVILLTINGSSGMPALAPRASIVNEEIWEPILYGYVIDPDAPSYLGRGNKIFDVVKDESIAIGSLSSMKIEFDYSDSEKIVSKSVAASMSIEGSYGAFSGAASMEVSSTSDSSIKTVRLDATIKAIQYEVSSKGGFRSQPEKYLTDDFKTAVDALTVEQIEKRIGIFYAISMDLGGEVRKSYTMQATKDDTQDSVRAELQASYGTSVMGVSAQASLGVTSRTSNSGAQINIEWSAKGGDTTVWLGKSFSDSGDTSVASIQSAWADTIADDNLYPFEYKLGLMWDLVKHVNQEKGVAFQQYLEQKWTANGNRFNPWKFLPVDSCVIQNFDFQGADIKEVPTPISSMEDCTALCAKEVGCVSVTHKPATFKCWLKKKIFGDIPYDLNGANSRNLMCGYKDACFKENYDFGGADIKHVPNTDSMSACAEMCVVEANCVSVTHRPATNDCWLKKKIFGDVPKDMNGVNSRILQCTQG